MNTVLENSLEQARPVFPFTAIVGQEEMKLALILSIMMENQLWYINPT